MMMDVTTFNKYLDCLASMCVDCRMGGITREAFLSNLELLTLKLINANRQEEGKG